MKRQSLTAVTAVAFIALLSGGVTAQAAELKVVSVIGMRAVMEELVPQFERETGQRVAISFGTLGGVIKLVEGGEQADLLIIPQQGIDRLRKDGKVAMGESKVIATSGLGVAVRRGAAKPDISSPEAFKRALLAAKTVTYANPAHGAASGIHFAKMLDRMGISDEIKSRTVFLPKPGPVGILVAEGKAEIAVHQMQELLPVHGIEIVGPLPGDLQETLVFVAATIGDVKRSEASSALVRFLHTRDAASVIKAKGMEPGTQ